MVFPGDRVVDVDAVGLHVRRHAVDLDVERPRVSEGTRIPALQTIDGSTVRKTGERRRRGPYALRKGERDKQHRDMKTEVDALASRSGAVGGREHGVTPEEVISVGAPYHSNERIAAAL
jgi:hypothetical protein